jgi:hypothetical protein
MKISEDKLLDKRLVHRHISRGLLTEASYTEHLAGLPDRADNATVMRVKLASVGVHDVKAKDTGEHE